MNGSNTYSVRRTTSKGTVAIGVICPDSVSGVMSLLTIEESYADFCSSVPPSPISFRGRSDNQRTSTRHHALQICAKGLCAPLQSLPAAHSSLHIPQSH